MTTKFKRDPNSATFLQHVEDGTTRVYENKEAIYAQGSPDHGVFYIQSGVVKLTMVSKPRRGQAVLALLHAGDLFGEDCLAKTTSRIATATSIGRSTITCLNAATVRHEIERGTTFAALFIRYLLAQNARLKSDLADHILSSSERRLARILLMHRCFVPKTKGTASDVRLDQTTLAEMVGTTRSRVNLFMKQFREKGYIRYTDGSYDGSLEIDAKRLATFLNGDNEKAVPEKSNEKQECAGASLENPVSCFFQGGIEGRDENKGPDAIIQGSRPLEKHTNSSFGTPGNSR